MRYSGDWMKHADDRILEYLSEHEAGSPSEIKREARIRYTPEHVARRCRELNNYGLIRTISAATYVITDRGRAYLEGDLDTQTLEPQGNQRTATA